MPKVKEGFENNRVSGVVGKRRFDALLKDLSDTDLQYLLDNDPRSFSRMIDTKPTAPTPLPKKPEA